MFNRQFFKYLPPVTKNLLIINVLIWAFMAIVRGAASAKLLEIGGLHYITSPRFGFWQLFTYMFIHANFWHLFFNMWALLMFGYVIERNLGSKRFLFYYISCGLGAALIQLGVFAVMINHLAGQLPDGLLSQVEHNNWMAPAGIIEQYPQLGKIYMLINTPTIGASGAVFGILIAFGMLYPNSEMYIMFVPYPIKAKWIVLGYGVLELAMGFGTQGDGVAHFAHLGGMLIGFIMIWYWRKQRKV